MDSNQPDEKTLAMLMVIADMVNYSGPGVDTLTSKYERAMEQIRWKRSGAPQMPGRSPYR
jgi:hypothetical protein